MKKITLIGLLFAFASFASDQEGSGTTSAPNVAEIDYITLFKSINGSFEFIGDPNPDFMMMTGVGSVNAGNNPLIIIDGIQE